MTEVVGVHGVELETILNHERRYCVAVDAKEPERIAALFGTDGELRYKDRVVKGRSRILAFYEEFFETAPRWWRHWTMNPHVMRSGDEVHVDLDLVALMEDEDGLELANSVYSDVLTLSDNGLEFKVKEIIPQNRFKIQGHVV